MNAKKLQSYLDQSKNQSDDERQALIDQIRREERQERLKEAQQKEAKVKELMETFRSQCDAKEASTAEITQRQIEWTLSEYHNLFQEMDLHFHETLELKALTKSLKVCSQKVESRQLNEKIT